MTPPVDAPTVAAAFSAAGFTHVVWIPDTHTGPWEAALTAAGLAPLRVCREGEAVALAAGLMLGGAVPLVIVQCTGFFEAGDAVRNVALDLKLPLKLLVGVRGWNAARGGATGDTCPALAEPVARAYGLPVTWVDSTAGLRRPLAEIMREFRDAPGPGVLLWAE